MYNWALVRYERGIQFIIDTKMSSMCNAQYWASTIMKYLLHQSMHYIHTLYVYKSYAKYFVGIMPTVKFASLPATLTNVNKFRTTSNHSNNDKVIGAKI